MWCGLSSAGLYSTVWLNTEWCYVHNTERWCPQKLTTLLVELANAPYDNYKHCAQYLLLQHHVLYMACFVHCITRHDPVTSC